MGLLIAIQWGQRNTSAVSCTHTVIHVLTVGFGPNITLVIVDILLPNFDGAFFRRDYLRLTRKPRLLEMSGVFWEADKQPNLCEAASGFTLSTV